MICFEHACHDEDKQYNNSFPFKASNTCVFNHRLVFAPLEDFAFCIFWGDFGFSVGEKKRREGGGGFLDRISGNLNPWPLFPKHSTQQCNRTDIKCSRVHSAGDHWPPPNILVSFLLASYSWTTFLFLSHRRKGSFFILPKAHVHFNGFGSLSFKCSDCSQFLSFQS